MKKSLLTLALLLTATMVNAQLYVSAAGGATYAAGQKKLSSSGKFTGSYGEGWQGQVRLGYFLSKKFGAELAVGYLYGDEQVVVKSPGIDIKGKGMAYGAALTGIYNITDNFYVKAGVLTKLSGKTLITGSIKQTATLPAVAFNPAAPPTAMVKLPVKVDLERENTGKFPLGFIAAFGFKLDLGSNFGIFTEMEYLGINVPANKSKLSNFSATIGSKKLSNKELLAMAGKLPAPLQTQFKGLLPLVQDDIVYVDNPTKAGEAKAVDAPYSSFGFNLGFTYTFNFGDKKDKIKE